MVNNFFFIDFAWSKNTQFSSSKINRRLWNESKVNLQVVQKQNGSHYNG